MTQTQKMVTLGSLDFSAHIGTSQLYQDLRGLNIPEPLAAVFGRFDLMNAYVLRNMQDTYAKALDTTAANLRLDSYLDDKNQDHQTTKTTVAGMALGGMFNGNNQTAPAQISIVGPPLNQQLPPPTPTPTPGPLVNQKTYTIVQAEVNSLVVRDPVAILNGAGEVGLATANSAFGIVMAKNGNQAIVARMGQEVDGYINLLPGTVYYIQTPGNPQVPVVFGSLGPGNVAKAVFRAETTTLVTVLDWPPFTVNP